MVHYSPFLRFSEHLEMQKLEGIEEMNSKKQLNKQLTSLSY